MTTTIFYATGDVGVPLPVETSAPFAYSVTFNGAGSVSIRRSENMTDWSVVDTFTQPTSGSATNHGDRATYQFVCNSISGGTIIVDIEV